MTDVVLLHGTTQGPSGWDLLTDRWILIREWSGYYPSFAADRLPESYGSGYPATSHEPVSAALRNG